ncbi:MAG: class I SAM-dependent RNA methyltransferase [Myxococcaceae bacterium]
MPVRLPLYATTARGTEDLLAEELAELGAAKIRQDRGGVRFHANLDEALRIAIWTRIAMRILYPLGEFEAQGAEGLYDAAYEVPWEEHLTTLSSFKVDATIRDSEHTHSGFVGLKIKDAIADRLVDKLGARPNVDTRDPNVTVVAHLAKEKLSLSLDLCGEPLHKRGYRVKTTVAPLKETLAAAVLRAAKYTGEEPLLDPMCGSGTIVIEAAMIAINRAPGAFREFAIERWPKLGEEATHKLNALREQARAQERAPKVVIYGFDKDPEALEAARANVNAARISSVVKLQEGDATAELPVPLEPRGIVVTNPPYGDRLKAGGQKGMKTFYFKLGDSLDQLQGWRFAILSGNEAFESAFHHRPTGVRDLWNGPIECQLLSYPAIQTSQS